MSDNAATLETRIKALEDRASIAELRARFCLFTDERRWQDLGELFTEDGVLDIRGPVQGRDGIIEMVTHLPDVWDSWFHAVDTETTTLAGDAATGVSYFDAPFVAEGTSFNALGRYDDEFSCVGAAWLFSRRTLSFAVSAPVADGWTGELPEGLRPLAG